MQNLFLLGFVTLLGASLVLGLNPKQKSLKGEEPIGPIEWKCQWDGVFPFPDSCDQYVECWNDVAVLWQCTDRMLFDLTYNGCNYAAYVHCEDRPRPTNVPSTLNPTSPTTTSNVSTSTTERPSEEFDCPGGGVFPHEERCEYYWKCDLNLVAELVHCQIDFLFDLVYMGCNYPEYTHCQDRERPPGVKPTLNPSPGTTSQKPTTPENTEPTTPYTGPSTTPTTTTTKEPGEGFECPEEDGYFSDPEDCTGFYTCSGGYAYHSYCPAGLYFDPVEKICNFPDLVDCSNRAGRKVKL